MRVLLLTQWFEPEPALKGLVLARALRDLGCDVEVVTGFPNYPGGNIYPGYKVRRIQRETIDGIPVIRLPLYPSHDNSAVRRIMNYVSFSASTAIFLVTRRRTFDIVYAYHPPLTVGITAALLKKIRGVPFVYDIQDMWPDSLSASGMLTNSLLLSLVERACQWVYAAAGFIVVLSPGFEHLLTERGVAPSKIRVIYNWCDESALNHEEPKPPSRRTDTVDIVFAGNMGSAQELETVLQAAQIVSTRSTSVMFTFVGDGIERDNLVRLADSMALSNVQFRPRVPMSEIGDILRSADCLLVHLRDDPLYDVTIPSKTQAYMSVGRPVLMAVRGDASKLVRDADCGVVATPGDASSIAAAAIKLALLSRSERDAMGKRGSDFYAQNLSVSSGSAKLFGIFQEIVADDRVADPDHSNETTL